MKSSIIKKQSGEKSMLTSLPLFAGLPDVLLEKLSEVSQVREYKKGKLLFLENEPCSRFYIVLSGWVKLFKGNATGEETVLQMLGANETIAESAVFLGVPYPASAQVAEDSVLLSIPAPIIREEIRNNGILALNMVTCISKHSQSMIHQIEATRLKSAVERVGWFLLKLAIESKHVSKEIRLPYDKAMIASFLAMTPETFSRTLKQFKDRGFKIESDAVTLPDINVLCTFCDEETASHCNRHETAECPIK